ncbi:alpha/beta hydrolase [Paenibacillus sp. WLX1005]|uniref:alpha/beta hydrolase n=1 Tax=Paenibacillus sp. WLX1005 TaxID=3243766 RepID=UPI0039841409
MPLDPQVQEFLDTFNKMPIPPLHTIDPKLIRSMEGKMAEQRQSTPVHEVTDIQMELADRTINVRKYTPHEQPIHPAIVFYHGGGWVLGSLDSHDELCRRLSVAAGAIVIAVEYRLAPENPYPAAVWDAYDALCYIAEHAAEWGVDNQAIAVAGDSAGGNLAAVVCLIAKDKGAPSIKGQLLIYPSTGKGENTDSYRENGQGYMLTAETMTWFRQSYFSKGENQDQPYASPLLYSDLSGLPPAIIITAQYDPLRDDGAQYADSLQQAGNIVEYQNEEGMIHGFLSMLQFDRSGEVLQEAGEKIRHILLS